MNKASRHSKNRLMEALGPRLRRAYARIGDMVCWWTRLEYTGPDRLPDGPALVVANHGFGALYDLNAYVLASLLEHRAPAAGTPITILSHEIIWTLGLGPLAEQAGLRPAGRDIALEALAAGHLVVVLPGGDYDAGKDFWHRNEVVLAGRAGFAAIAKKAGVPIVPVVIAGAGETAFVLSNGERLAKWLRLDRLLQIKVLPVSLSLPWGLTVGFSGFAVPYLPLPAKMYASILPPMRAEAGDNTKRFAERVHACMNTRMKELTAERLPFFGTRRRRRK